MIDDLRVLAWRRDGMNESDNKTFNFITFVFYSHLSSVHLRYVLLTKCKMTTWLVCKG